MNFNINQKVVEDKLITRISGHDTVQDFVFTINIPSIVFAMDIPDSCKLLYGYIFSFNGNGKDFFASNQKIAEMIGKDPPTVRRLLLKLENAGLIRREYRQGVVHKERMRIVCILPSTTLEVVRPRSKMIYPPIKNDLPPDQKRSHTKQVTKQVTNSIEKKKITISKRKPFKETDNQNSEWQSRGQTWATRLDIPEKELLPFFALFKKYRDNLPQLEYQCGNVSDAPNVHSKTALLTTLIKKVLEKSKG